MPKTIAEIQQGLQTVYNGPTFEKNGFTYIPWNEAAKQANTVFGIDGYDVDVLDVHQVGAAGYAATVRVTVFPTDGRAFSRTGIGFNELTGDNGRAHDTAFKGAASDALNRALKLFGPAFGLNLYDKAETGNANWTPRQNTTPTAKPAGNAQVGATKTVGGDLGKRPSEKQAAILERNGIDFSNMPFAEWKAVLDGIFAKSKGSAPTMGSTAPAAPVKKPAPAPVAVAAADDDDAFLSSFLGSDDE